MTAGFVRISVGMTPAAGKPLTVKEWARFGQARQMPRAIRPVIDPEATSPRPIPGWRAGQAVVDNMRGSAHAKGSPDEPGQQGERAMARATRRHAAEAAATDLAGWKIRWGTTAAQDQAIQVVEDWLAGIVKAAANPAPKMTTAELMAKRAAANAEVLAAIEPKSKEEGRTGKPAKGRKADPNAPEPVKVRTTKRGAPTAEMKAAEALIGAAQAKVDAAHAADDMVAHAAAIEEYTDAHAEFAAAIKATTGKPATPKKAITA